MPTTYALPDGYTVTAHYHGSWNGFPVPLLAPEEYQRLVDHMIYMGDPYTARRRTDGGAYWCDGLAWEIVTA